MTDYFIEFNDESDLTINECEITFTDYGIQFTGESSTLFIPYGSIKLLTDNKGAITTKRKKK